MKDGPSQPSALPLSDGTSLSTAWAPFQGRLAEALGALEEDQYLIIGSKRGWAYVQFAAQGAFGLRAESVSNNYLPQSEALTTEKIDALQQLGWRSPTGTPREATAKRQPDGSPNFFRDFARPVSVDDVAQLAVRTLAEVMEIPHPGHLDYHAFDSEHRTIVFPTLGLMRRPPAPRAPEPAINTIERIREAILPAIRAASGDADLAFTDEGHVSVRFGSAVVVLRVQKDPLCVSITSPIVAHVEPHEALEERINELNAQVRFARFFALDATIYGAVEVFASPFVVEHVVQACGLLGNLADEIDDMLQDQFGGRTAFGAFRINTSVH